ncbi:MAG TPA: DUF5652 family protein [Candidatus Paceibacterota bacterium]
MYETLSNGEQLALAALLLWTLPWKGMALWKAARKSQQKWFIALLLLQTLAILDILYIFVFSERNKKNVLGVEKVK